MEMIKTLFFALCILFFVVPIAIGVFGAALIVWGTTIKLIVGVVIRLI